MKSIKNPQTARSLEPDPTSAGDQVADRDTLVADAQSCEDFELERTFQTLAAKWKVERGHIASVNKMVRLPAYRAIVNLGPKVIRLLLRELDRQPDHWFWALKELTGQNPVAAESRGDVAEMARCWVLWGKQNGYQW